MGQRIWLTCITYITDEHEQVRMTLIWLPFQQVITTVNIPHTGSLPYSISDTDMRADTMDDTGALAKAQQISQSTCGPIYLTL